MSHTDVGPLPAYNSLTDNHLAGYFSNTRMRRHLRKSGLITRKGELVSENGYRLGMARKEHKKHVKNMLAQAIVHKTLDLERSRQAEIRKKLEEIAKIELVRRVRSERHRHLEDAILPYLAPKSAKAQTKQSKKSATSRIPSGKAVGHQETTEIKESNGKISAVQERASREKKRESCILPLVSPKGGSRPSSSSTYSEALSKGRYRPVRPKSTPSRYRKGKRPISALSSNFDDENETVVYLDDEGRPISPSHIDESELRYTSKDPIDTRHLYSLDTTALRKYAMLMAKLEQGKDNVNSPYLSPQVPIPPKSPHHGGTPRSAHRYRGSSARLESPKRPTVSDQAYLHPPSSAKSFPGQQESMCEIFMLYHGYSLSLAREQFDKRQDVVVEQQHCGGNTLTVFRDKMEPNTEFSFISYRHCGYPFALSIYIDGKMDCRISTCCEYRHSKGKRIAGKKGHFSVKTITGAKPCYKCQVEKGIRVKSAAPRPKLKRPPKAQEEVVVVETKEEPQEEKVIDNSGHVKPYEEEILVPVDHLEEDKNYEENEIEGDNYDDDDFEDSEPEEAYVYSGVYSTERGVEDGDDGDEQSGKEVKNIIKIANKRVEEAAIKERRTDVDDGIDERGSRTKKDPRKVTRDEDVEEDSLSSCRSDEDYYEYKKRMLKKLKEQEVKKIRKNGKTKAVSNTEDLTESGSKCQDQDGKGHTNKGSQDGKKKCSTSSVLEEAERVDPKPAKKHDVTGKGSKRRSQQRKKGTAEGESSSDGNATADDVSEIESEMAASSPRKADKEKRETEGQAFDIKSVENLDNEKYRDKLKVNTEETSKDSIILSSANKSCEQQCGKFSYKSPLTEYFPKSELMWQDIGEEGNEILNGKGKDFHVDICPADSTLRGEGDFEENSKAVDKYDNLRGVADQEEVRDCKSKNLHRGKKSQQDGKASIHHGNKNSVNTADDTNVLQTDKEKRKQLIATKENEIMIHPMPKTGENKYLQKQMKEQVELRIQSENAVKNSQDNSKRKGMYIKDLSPRMQVIRGNVGDDGSESDGDGDETYSRILLRDGRASVSDTEHDSDPRRRDYVLAESNRLKCQKQHVTFIESAIEHFDEDTPHYRVLIDVGQEEKKEKYKEAKERRKKDRDVRRQKRLEDTRGATHHTTEVQCSEHEIVNPTEDDVSVEVHPQQQPKSKEIDEDKLSAEEVEDDFMRHKHFPQENGDDNDVFHQQFGEEPLSRITGRKEPLIQAVPNLGIEINASEEDDEVVEGNKEMSNNEEALENAYNPETWYEMSTSHFQNEDDKNIEIVGTKYVDNENERYAHHYKAFKESPDVDNDFLKRSQGVVSILSSQDQVFLDPETQADVLHISVLSQNKKQIQEEDKKVDLSPSVVIESDSNKALDQTGVLVSEDDQLIKISEDQQTNGHDQKKQKFVASPRLSLVNVTAVDLRDLWLGSGARESVDTADEENKTANEKTKGLDKPNSGNNIEENQEVNVSYADDFSESDEEENKRRSWERSKALVEDQVEETEKNKDEIRKKNEEESRTNLPHVKLVEDDAKNTFYEEANPFNNNKPGNKCSRESMEATKGVGNVKEDDSSSDDVHGIDELIEVLENQLESSKKSRIENCGSKAGNVPIQNLKTIDTDSFNLELNSSSKNFQSIDKGDLADEGNINHFHKNSFGVNNSSMEDNYTESIAEGDCSSDDLESHAKVYVNQMLASLSIVGFNNESGQNPTATEEDVVQQENSEETEGTVTVVTTSNRRIRELTRQAPVLTENENMSNLSLNNQDIGLDGEEPNHDTLKLNVNDNLAPLSPHNLPSTSKGSSLVDPNSPHTEQRRQQKLTVSFAFNPDSEGNDDASEGKDDHTSEIEKSWEEADDLEREEEYKRLERQIQKSLCKKP